MRTVDVMEADLIPRELHHLPHTFWDPKNRMNTATLESGEVVRLRWGCSGCRRWFSSRVRLHRHIRRAGNRFRAIAAAAKGEPYVFGASLATISPQVHPPHYHSARRRARRRRANRGD